ncbi:2056_t:CDS:2, partial [Dentiscutata erythropus]
LTIHPDNNKITWSSDSNDIILSNDNDKIIEIIQSCYNDKTNSEVLITYSKNNTYSSQNSETIVVEDSITTSTKRRTYACDYQDTYIPKKSVILENQRNSKSKRSGCPWHINVNFPKKANRTLPEAVIREISFYTAEGNLNATIQRKLLSVKFPDITIYPRNLQNLMQKFKAASREENDASKLLKWLLTKKAEEPEWEVFWELYNKTKSLDKVFWMSPEQVQL